MNTSDKSDRELLELAAKAAGIARLVWGEKYRVGDTEVDCTDLPYIPSDSPDESPAYWNPLEDDGDALRLAVKLRFMVDQADDQADVLLEGYVEGVERMYSEPHGSDPYSATRRAIVRAAAAIGAAQ